MDPLLLDIAKQSPILCLVYLWFRQRDSEAKQFLEALNRIQETSRQDAKEAWALVREIQRESREAQEAASVALSRHADATRALEYRLERMPFPPETNGDNE